MKPFFTLRLCAFAFFAITTNQGNAQNTGDFQTKNNTGIWSNSDSWNVRKGTTWSPAATGQLPLSSSDVFVQPDHLITVDNDEAVCDNLHVDGSITSKLSFAVPKSALNVKGNIRLFSSAHNCFGSWAGGAKIVFSGTGTQGFTNLSSNAEFLNIEINKSSGTATLTEDSLSVNHTLFLTNGTLNIGAEGTLILKSGNLIAVAGNLIGTNSSNLTITGSSTDTVLLPLAANISLQHVMISGTRVFKMDGENDINLSGVLAIDSFATYDNGGTSRLINDGGSIAIKGKFITKDVQGFIGSGAAIPTIIPVLHPGCTIEYGGMGNQEVQSSPSYKNVTFSGSGVKTPSNAFYPQGTIYITGSAVLNASANNIGDSVTKLTMDGGRLVLGTTGTQPKMEGVYNITGGIIQFDGRGQSIRSTAYQNIEVTGSDVRNSSGNITLNDGGTFIVKSGGAFRINADAITGPSGNQTITVDNGGLFKCGNNKGFHGFVSTFSASSSIHQNIENIILAPGSNIEYVQDGDQPITNFNNLVYSNLIISGVGIKTAPEDTLTIAGNLTKTGQSVFNHNKGTVLFKNSTDAQNYAAALPGITFYNVKDSATSSAGLSVNGEMLIEGRLTLGASSTLTVNGDITLLSTSANTAAVAELPESAMINYGTGLFIVERYFTPKRAWRFLSVPTNTLQSIKESWQEGALASGEIPKAGYGTQITGKFAPDLINGFDYYSNGPSVKKYDQVNDKWIGISGTNIPVASKEGLMTFVRGDRTANNLYAPVSATVLRTKGRLNTGVQDAIIVIPQQFVSLGNPYASAVDMRKIITANVDKTFYVWDPKLTGNGFGAYQTFTLIGNEYYPNPGSGSYGDPEQPYNYIQSGQAFFVRNSTPESGSVTFSESAKASGDSLVNNTFVFRPAEKTPVQIVRTTLYRINTNETADVLDGTLTVYGNDFSNTTDKEDAVKATNFGENLGIKDAEKKILSIEKRFSIRENDTIRLNLTNAQYGQYKLILRATNFKAGGLTACLEDNYTNKLTPISLTESSLYNFSVQENAASQNPDRFRIVFKAIEGPLPVTFTSVKAYQQQRDIMVKWNVENEKNSKEYIVEKSLNGQHFFTANTVTSKKNKNLLNKYDWLDENAVTGNNYYRILSVSLNGETKYSAVVNVWSGNHRPQMLITPNPLVDNFINLQFINQPKGIYTIKLCNISGQVLATFNKDHQQGSSSETMRLITTLPNGIYLLNIKGSAKEFTFRLLK